MRRAALGAEVVAQSAPRADAETVVGRLAVDQKFRSRGQGLCGLRTIAAPLFADDEQQPDVRDPFTAQRSRPPPPGTRRFPSRRTTRGHTDLSPSRWLGKNGGTQSRCVESTTSALPNAGVDVASRALDDLLDDAVAGFAQQRRHPQHAIALRARSSSRCRPARASRQQRPSRSIRTHCSRFVRASVFRRGI